MIETFGFEGFDEGLNVAIGLRTVNERTQTTTPILLENRIEVFGKKTIAVMNEKGLAIEQTIKAIDLVASDLCHPFAVGVMPNTSAPHFA